MVSLNFDEPGPKDTSSCDPGQVDKLDPKLPWLEKAKGDDEGLFSRIVEHEELISQ